MLNRNDILRGLRKIDARARADGVVIDLAVYGGAALAMSFDMRDATRDVDAVAKGDQSKLRMWAAEIAEEEGWPEDWLNDGVKGFVSAHEKMVFEPSFSEQQEQGAGGLRVYTPAPEYLFAMKCMAMRPQGVDGSHDISDIIGLAKIIGVASPEEAIALVESFYPTSRIPPKVKFGVEEIMDRIQAEGYPLQVKPPRES